MNQGESQILGDMLFPYLQSHCSVCQPPLCEEMAEELRFALQCFGSSTKPAKRPPKVHLASDRMEGNGMTLMPLAGYPMHNHSVPIKDIKT